MLWVSEVDLGGRPGSAGSRKVGIPFSQGSFRD